MTDKKTKLAVLSLRGVDGNFVIGKNHTTKKLETFWRTKKIKQYWILIMGLWTIKSYTLNLFDPKDLKTIKLD